MSNHQGVFCISIDAQFVDAGVAGLAERNQDIWQLIRQFGLSANATIQTIPKKSLSHDREATLIVAPRVERSALVQTLGRMNATLARDGRHLQSVVMDPHEANRYWDLLVRAGCQVVRPRMISTTQDPSTRILRGGLWVSPISCSFVGGSRRSVRQLFSQCQRRLVAASQQRRVFHLNVDISRDRKSWREELEALRALLQTATALRDKSRLQCATLSELPSLLSRKSVRPMTSVLRRVG